MSGLLRGQQGTEAQVRAGIAVGATVVFLNEAVARGAFSGAERGLDLVWRAGPAGAAPGGIGFAERLERVGVHHRSWSPAHLSVTAEEGGLRVGWVPRVRVGGDGWDLEPVEIDGRRFRVRVLDGDVERRVVEVEGSGWVYAASAMAKDFPGGFGPSAQIAVAQWSAGFGWGGRGRGRVVTALSQGMGQHPFASGLRCPN